MKTSHFSENYDLCHPLVGCENSNNNSNIVTISYGHPSTTVTSGVVTYGNSSTEQTSNFEKNANEFQIKQQQRQQQQEQNKKRKRETGEYCSKKKFLDFFFASPLHVLYMFFYFLKNVVILLL